MVWCTVEEGDLSALLPVNGHFFRDEAHLLLMAANVS